MPQNLEEKIDNFVLHQSTNAPTNVTSSTSSISSASPTVTMSTSASSIMQAQDDSNIASPDDDFAIFKTIKQEITIVNEKYEVALGCVQDACSNLLLADIYIILNGLQMEIVTQFWAVMDFRDSVYAQNGRIVRQNISK